MLLSSAAEPSTQTSYIHCNLFLSLLPLLQFRHFSSNDDSTSDIAPEWSNCLTSFYSHVLLPSVWNSSPMCHFFLKDISSPEGWHFFTSTCSTRPIIFFGSHASPFPALYLILQWYGTMYSCQKYAVLYFESLVMISPLPIRICSSGSQPETISSCWEIVGNVLRDFWLS